MLPLHVVILAAGEGKRMQSATPKVLHRLAGRTLLELVVAVAKSLQADTTHVVYGHGGAQVIAASEQLDVHWVEQREQLGTGHAVHQAMPAVGDDAVVLVLYGDVPLLEPETARSAVEFARLGAVGLVTVQVDDADGYGRILRDPDGRVSDIVEHRDATAEQRSIGEINTGIVAAPAACVKRWLAALQNDNKQGEYYLTDLIAAAVADGVTVHTVCPASSEEVLGVNDRVQLAVLERYQQRRLARRLMLAGTTLADPERIDIRGEVLAGRDCEIDVNVVFEGRVTLGERVKIGPNVTIRDSHIGSDTQVLANCVIEQGVVGAGCRIGPFARIRPEAELGDQVRIGNFVEIKKSRIGFASKVNHLTYLGDTLVGERVNVGAGTITCNYDGANKHQTVIGDDASIGSGVELVAPVVVNEGATIGAGSTVSRDVPANTLVIARARETVIAGWERPRKKK